MREVDSRHLDSAVRALPALHDEVGRFLDPGQLKPREGSTAESELTYALGKFKPADVYSQAGLLIQIAADHLMAFCRTVQEPAQSIAPWTSARSLLEASAIAAWLLEPGIEPKKRIGRGYAFRYEGLQQQVKAARAGKWSEEEQRYAEERIIAVEDDAVDGYGFERLRDNRRRRTGIGQGMPAVTEIVRDILDEEEMYRVLSAMAHGHSWAVTRLSYYVDTTLATKADTPWVPVRKTLYAEHVVLLCWLCAKWLTRPIWYNARLFGLDTGGLIPIFEKAADDIGVVPAARYWRAA